MTTAALAGWRSRPASALPSKRTAIIAAALVGRRSRPASALPTWGAVDAAVLAAAILISKVSRLAPLVAPLPRDLPDSLDSVVPLEMTEPSELSLRLDRVELALLKSSPCLRGMWEGLGEKNKTQKSQERF